MLQFVLDHLFITRRRALALGFTHEGTLFGVPAWMMDVEHEAIVSCPKIPLLQLWALLADCAYEFASWFMYEDQQLASPIRVLRPIAQVTA